MNPNAKPILVIGGGIAGITAALEAAEVGYRVILVEKEAYLGGRVVRSHQYFPKMCPPTCGFEINTRRIRQNPRVTVYTQATVDEISGAAGNFSVRLKIKPRYITGTHILDESIAEKLTSERLDDFNLDMGKTKALYTPHDMTYPQTQVLDRDALSDEDVYLLKQICPPGAIDLDMTEDEVLVKPGAIILATGWRPYDAAKIDNLGFGRCENVITNVMMERLAAQRGPTGGEIVRPSDGKAPENVAFVQCAGSRDENHLPYCSAVCCMASLKQARYLREKIESAKATIFYIDLRTIGRLEKFYYDMVDDENVAFVKGKVAAINEDSATKNLTLDVEDTIERETMHATFDMVVLATGIVPNSVDEKIPLELKYDEYGYVDGLTNIEGVFAAGCATHPCDVARTTKEATAAALKAIQCIEGD
ncbi:MAG: CoB--CoM heterodisulfide reductase iron-sulfur subunit A family protein [Candidatus Latescibacterota bacterium]|nr:MAG: CoB--CoM heterodisulfide reductase iron-sulfur subunit A family protein [Candidatus Latescibacterota bacterium]